MKIYSSLPRPLRLIAEFISSIRLALVAMTVLTLAFMAGTILESIYDTPTAKYWVYQARWFHAGMVLFAINIFFAALSRWPWKLRHTAFLLAHAGILLLLVGSLLTDRFGIDGMLRVSEGQSTTIVEMDQPLLVVTEGERTQVLPVQWLPPHVQFKPFSLKKSGFDFDVTLAEFLSHADPEFKFRALKDGEVAPVGGKGPALKLTLKGGPMRINQDVWLWGGDPAWSIRELGPAVFGLGMAPGALLGAASQGRPQIAFFVTADGIRFESVTSKGAKKTGTIKTAELSAAPSRPVIVKAGWAAGVELRISEWIPQATAETSYVASRVQYGMGASPSAIRLAGYTGESVWLGIGDRAVLRVDEAGREVEFGYYFRRLALPFSVRLERFNIERYAGTRDPSSYSSQVSVESSTAAPFQTTISMNEPLSLSGFTLYQASYEDAEPRPVTSILSVNQDPGRVLKYLGSLFLVGGIIVLFKQKLKTQPKPKTGASL